LGDWVEKLKFNPLPPLISSKNIAIHYFSRRDLLEESVESTESLWKLPQVMRLLRRQQLDGAWKYPGGGKLHLRSTEDYNQLETYRIFGELVEKYGLDKRHPAIEKAARYMFSKQTSEGDFRGIYGIQYSPNYSAAIMELLIKAGYEADTRIEDGLQWLLSMSQEDGGWTIPLRTAGIKFNRGILFQKSTVQPDKTKPFSHLITGIVSRAFAAHTKYRTAEVAKKASELLASRFFKRDAYPDRQHVDFWLKFSYPFWQTDLLSSLDSLSTVGICAEKPQVEKALKWFISKQQQNGIW
jgi:hypothetical protein